MNLSESLGNNDNLSDVGGKGANLARLKSIGIPVPSWFCIPAAEFEKATKPLHLSMLLKTLSKGDPDTDLKDVSGKLQDEVKNLTLPPSLVEQVLETHKQVISQETFFAVRSSALDEDSADTSFAGLHDSFMYIKDESGLVDSIKNVWASAFNHRALSYRLENNLPLSGIAIAVIVQEMVDASVSGVMFTCNPTTSNPHEVMISSVLGAGEGLVSAGLAADVFVMRKNGEISDKIVVEKDERMVVDTEAGSGLKKETVNSDQATLPSLTDDQLKMLVSVGCEIENHYGFPQDIEFCLDADNALSILQTRPVTTVQEYGPAAGNRLIWDNSNIIESYSGPTSPMTFSFIRRAYTIVYHCFSEVMGIPPKVVRKNQHVFENMLGLFHGQVYYNLVNWYRLVHLFPGFDYNKGFMESMMGLKESLDIGDDELEKTFTQRYLIELPKLLKLVARSTWNFRRIDTLVGRFNHHFKTHYTVWEAMDFTEKAPHELLQVYLDMEEALLWNWKTPIINDFYVMMFYGMLKKKCADWCGDTNGSLQNDLICGEGGIESTEPTKMLMRMALAAKNDAYCHALFLKYLADELVTLIPNDPKCQDMHQAVEHYLKLYGFRCMNELKLEEPSLRENPVFIYQMIQNYLKLKDEAAFNPDAKATKEQDIRRDAEHRAFSQLTPAKKVIFRWILKNARAGVKNRENMRFARTRIYGMLRDLLNAVGQTFTKEGIIDAPHDIFSLTIDEVWDFIKGTAVTTDLRALIAVRKKEFTAYQDEVEPPPDDHFETFGLAYHRNAFKNWKKEEETDMPEGMLKGIGCCPGTVTGTVRVLKSPTDNMTLNGEILVAGRTDPGWVPLYPAISGILIERGSILSHSAIVAREMGIPTIVGIPNLLNSLEDGQIVEMDGQSGWVTLPTHH